MKLYKILTVHLQESLSETKVGANNILIKRYATERQIKKLYGDRKKKTKWAQSVSIILLWGGNILKQKASNTFAVFPTGIPWGMIIIQINNVHLFTLLVAEWLHCAYFWEVFVSLFHLSYIPEEEILQVRRRSENQVLEFQGLRWTVESAFQERKLGGETLLRTWKWKPEENVSVSWIHAVEKAAELLKSHLISGSMARCPPLWNKWLQNEWYLRYPCSKWYREQCELEKN